MSIIGLSDHDFPEDLTPTEIREKLDRQGFKPEFRPSDSLTEEEKTRWKQRKLSELELQILAPSLPLTPERIQDLYKDGIEQKNGVWYRWFKKALAKQASSPESLPFPSKGEMSVITKKQAEGHPEPLPDPEEITEKGCETLATLGFTERTSSGKSQVDNPDKEPFPSFMDIATKLGAITAETFRDPKVKELIEFMKKSEHIPLDLLDFEWGNGLVKTFLLEKTDISERRIDEISKEISKSLLLGIQKRKFPDPLSFFAPSSPEAWGIDMNSYYEKVRDVMSKANAALKSLETKMCAGEKK
jgi:hypothetical protein